MKTNNIFNKLYLYYTLNSKCASKNHFGIPIYFCSEKTCNKGFICSQCLTEDISHFSQHVKHLIALDDKKNFFNFFGINNIDSIINYSQQKPKKINDTKNFYDYIKNYIINFFEDKSRNNFFKNKKIFDNYFLNEKEKEFKNNEYINKKINDFINNNDKYKIKELIEELKPYINEQNNNNEKYLLDKINNILNDELNIIIEKCANIFKSNKSENDNNFNQDIKEKNDVESSNKDKESTNKSTNNYNDIMNIIEKKIDNNNENNLSLSLNNTNKNKSFYEGSINNVSMIKTESNIDKEEFISKLNNNLNNSFFKKIEKEEENEIKNNNNIKQSINKLPFNIFEFQKRDKNILNNINNNILNISPKSTIAAANNFQFYNSNNDIINELEIKLNQIHNKDSAINISINNNYNRKNFNNINNIKIKNIYKTERQITNNIINNNKHEGEKLHIKTKNNLSRLNKIREQIGKIIK